MTFRPMPGMSHLGLSSAAVFDFRPPLSFTAWGGLFVSRMKNMMPQASRPLSARLLKLAEFVQSTDMHT